MLSQIAIVWICVMGWGEAQSMEIGDGKTFRAFFSPTSCGVERIMVQMDDLIHPGRSGGWETLNITLGDGVVGAVGGVCTSSMTDPESVTTVWKGNVSSSLFESIGATLTTNFRVNGSLGGIEVSSKLGLDGIAYLTEKGESSGCNQTREACYVSIPLYTQLESGKEPLRFWAPWDRESYQRHSPYTNPLLPSDGARSGFWTGCYRYGSPRASSCNDDFLVIPGFSVFTPTPSTSSFSTGTARGVGIAVLLSPEDDPYELQFHPSSSGSLTLVRGMNRVGEATSAAGRMVGRNRGSESGGGASFEVKWFIAALERASWRLMLERAQRLFPSFVLPTNIGGSRAASGLGSYTSSSSNPVPSDVAALGYAVDWRLSGTYMPYMGMFYPPPPVTEWWNDPEGTQEHKLVSFEDINMYDQAMLEQSFLPNSYFNINEFGTNISSTPPPSPDPHANWSNANAYLYGVLPRSPLMYGVQPGYGTVAGGKVQYTWQRGIAIDSLTPKYASHLASQMKRHVSAVLGFSGVVVDRSDWSDWYTTRDALGSGVDDGWSVVPSSGSPDPYQPLVGHPARSLRTAWIQTMKMLRPLLDEGRERVALWNTYGNARLDFAEYFDGTFSEGHAVSAVGLLGFAMPARTLWTYDLNECCGTLDATRQFFAKHLLLGVFPMAPFPKNDHSIPYSAQAMALYAPYGPLFQSLRNSTYCLTPGVVEFDNATEVQSTLAINAFVRDTQLLITVSAPWDLPTDPSTTILIANASTILNCSAPIFTYIHPNQSSFSPLPTIPTKSPSVPDLLRVDLPLHPATGACLLHSSCA